MKESERILTEPIVGDNRGKRSKQKQSHCKIIPAKNLKSQPVIINSTTMGRKSPDAEKLERCRANLEKDITTRAT